MVDYTLQAPRRDYFQTPSGAVCYILDPWGSDILLSDIAVALARANRYGGRYAVHILGGYSVAQHSVQVSRKCDPEDALYGLFHDAAEAYLGDMIAPMKWMFPQFKVIENHWLNEIGRRFGMHSLAVKPESVEVADKLCGLQEKYDLLARGPGFDWWGKNPKPWPQECIVPMDELTAREAFLERYWDLV